MAGLLNSATDRATTLWSRSTLAQRVLIGGLLASVLVAFFLLVTWLNVTEYQVLYANLYSEDASRVVQTLDKNNVSYQLRDGGGTILVPADQVYDMRLKVAGEGMLHGQGIGFEIFDESKIGQTDFVQQINYQRALQGELSRTISQIPAVESARVHLVLPDRSLFIEEQLPPSASVMLELRPGRELSPKQVQSVVNLVASGVEGLSRDTITVADTMGTLLYQPDGEESLDGMSSSQLEYKAGLERKYEQRIEQMLTPIIGPGRVIAKVNTDLDFDRRTIHKELYDPDSAVVRSEQTSDETSSGTTNLAAGVPEPAVGGQVPVNGQGNTQETTRGSATTNFEINKEEHQIIGSVGQITRLSAAVIVDGTYEANGDGESVYVPRSDEDMQRITQLVQSAIGYDSVRDDAIEVSNIAFGPPPAIQQASFMDQMAETMPRFWKPLLNTLIVLLFLILVVRPLVLALLRPRVSQGRGVGMAGLSESARLALGESEGPEDLAALAMKKRLENIQNRVSQTVDQDPDSAVNVVKKWMREGEA